MRFFSAIASIIVKTRSDMITEIKNTATKAKEAEEDWSESDSPYK